MAFAFGGSRAGSAACASGRSVSPAGRSEASLPNWVGLEPLEPRLLLNADMSVFGGAEQDQAVLDAAGSLPAIIIADQQTQGIIEDNGVFTVEPGAETAVLGIQALEDALAEGSVTINTASAEGFSDIVIAADISWASDVALTLRAAGDIVLAENVTVGNTGGAELTLRADKLADGQGTVVFDDDAAVDFQSGTVEILYNPGGGYANPFDFAEVVSVGDGVFDAWMLVNDVHDLQAISSNLLGDYALGGDIDAAVTALWNEVDGAYLGFEPIGDGDNAFTGRLDGRGHAIEALTIDRTEEAFVGLFGAMKGEGGVRDLALKDIAIHGQGGVGPNPVQGVGGLVGVMGEESSVADSWISGAVHGDQFNVGGLVGLMWYDAPEITNVHVTVEVHGGQRVGGVVGAMRGEARLVEANYSGEVSGGWEVGGLLGSIWNAVTVTDSKASGEVTGSGGLVGGLIGESSGSSEGSFANGVVVSDSYATTNVSSAGGQAGGLIGQMVNNTNVTRAYATGNVTGTTNVGGLVGWLDGLGTLEQAYATGEVLGEENAGGLIGRVTHEWGSGNITNVYASGPASAETLAGGLIGGVSVIDSVLTVTNAYASGKVGGDQAGGLIGSAFIDDWFEPAHLEVSGSFFDAAATDQDEAVAELRWPFLAEIDVTGLPTELMQHRQPFVDAGWDFDNVWTMIDGQTYPRFVWEDVVIEDHVGSLPLGTTVRGRIADPGGEQQWRFAAEADLLVVLDIVARENPGLVFTLTAPEGHVLFEDAVESLAAVTLPATGEYILTVRGLDDAEGAYSFRLSQDAQPLPLEVDVAGELFANNQSALYRLTAPGSMPLVVTLDVEGPGVYELYARQGEAPTPGTYDHRGEGDSTTVRRILVPEAEAGDWYVLVYGPHVPEPASYTLRAETPAIVVDAMIAGSMGQIENGAVSFRGGGFDEAVAVEFIGAGDTHMVTNVEAASPGTLVAWIDTSEWTLGRYDAVVTKGGESVVMEEALTITATSIGPVLSSAMKLPGSVGVIAPATFGVSFENTGDTPMTAPLMRLDSSNGRLTPDAAGVTSSRVTWAGDGMGIPGMLLPGESADLSIFYRGLADRFGFDNELWVGLEAFENPDATPVGWEAVTDEISSPLSAEARAELMLGAEHMLGTNWGSLFAGVSEVAQFLGHSNFEASLRDALQVAAMLGVIEASVETPDAGPTAAALVVGGFAEQSLETVTFGPNSSGEILNNPVSPTKVIFVGKGWTEGTVDNEAKSAILAREPDAMIVAVDWADAAQTTYPQASRNAAVVGEEIAAWMRRPDVNISASKTEVVGHSLFGHVGAAISANSEGRLAAIYAADSPWYYPDDPITGDFHKLNSDAAELVVQIRTTGLGGEELGDANFNVDLDGGLVQRHQDAWRLLIQSIDPETQHELEAFGYNAVAGGVFELDLRDDGGPTLEDEERFFENFEELLRDKLGDEFDLIHEEWIDILRAIDPNDKLAPNGVGEANYVHCEQVLDYRIRFENIGEGSINPVTGDPFDEDKWATAPAQQVTITDPLDENLDWTTFNIQGFGFGDTIVNVPEQTQYFEETIPLSQDGTTFNVEIVSGIDLETGVVFVEFHSIDPETHLPPNVLTGFLPPEDGEGAGMGYFEYSIQPAPGLATGTEIRNVAEIVFDQQQTIATNQADPFDPDSTTPEMEALVTIDNTPPMIETITAAPDLDAGDVDELTLVFSEPVEGAASAITIQTPDGSLLVGGTDLAVSGFGTDTLTVSIFTAPTQSGQYTLQVEAGAITDRVGHLLIDDNTRFDFSLVVEDVDVTPPTASLEAGDVAGAASDHQFTVIYSDDVALDVATIIDNDAAIRVTGPDDFDQFATFVSIDDGSDGTLRTVTYSIDAPTGEWHFDHNGVYTVWLEADQVADTAGNFAAAGELGTFAVNLEEDESGEDVVDHEVDPNVTRSSFDRRGNELVMHMDPIYIGQTPLEGPLRLVITQVSHPSVTVNNPDGITSSGLPYFDLDVAGTVVEPGQTLGPLVVAFHNPGRLQFTFDAVLRGDATADEAPSNLLASTPASPKAQQKAAQNSDALQHVDVLALAAAERNLERGGMGHGMLDMRSSQTPRGAALGLWAESEEDDEPVLVL